LGRIDNVVNSGIKLISGTNRRTVISLYSLAFLLEELLMPTLVKKLVLVMRVNMIHCPEPIYDGLDKISKPKAVYYIPNL
jgi:hypothetical protein